MLSLRDKLTPLDKDIFKNYVTKHGALEKHYIGNEEYLKYWDQSKKKLYRLLGEQFSYSFDFAIEKSDNIIRKQIKELKRTNSNFVDMFFHFLVDLLDSTGDGVHYRIMNGLSLINNKIDFNFKGENKYGKTLQIQKGQKTIKAIQKIISFYKDDYLALSETNKILYVDLINYFEKFRIEHSQILNDKELRGKITISIHPMDFITMSDNDSNWSSCMNWTNSGCYRIGSVEMMNSNNVLCCFIDSKNQFLFNEDYKDEAHTWNNKKWRQLVFFTKDIVVAEKAYPYENVEISKLILNKIRELAKKNLNWEYTYGPEEYHDMDYFNDICDMDRFRDYIQTNSAWKRSILFDTKGMYNDLLNDSNTTYLCLRNNIKKGKIISISGKDNCLCCNRPVLVENEYYSDDYNERYENVGSLVCTDCSYDFICDECSNVVMTEPFYIYEQNGQTRKICKSCFDLVKKCPCCNNNFMPGIRYDKKFYIKTKDVDIVYKNFQKYVFKFIECGKDKEESYLIGYCCNTCYDEIVSGEKEFLDLTLYDSKYYIENEINIHPWEMITNDLITKTVYDKDDPNIVRLLLDNLEPGSYIREE